MWVVVTERLYEHSDRMGSRLAEEPEDWKVDSFNRSRVERESRILEIRNSGDG